MLRKISAFFLIFILIFSSGCQSKSTDLSGRMMSRNGFMLDTIVSIKIYGVEDEGLMDRVFLKIEELEKKLSAHLENSEINQLKINAGQRYTKISDETYQIIKRSVVYSRKSDGLFDVTAQPLIELWGIDTDRENLPSIEKIQDILPLINYEAILFNDEEHSVMLSESGMAISLGAIAKGYIADELVSYLKANGVTRGILNLGGNLYLLGHKLDGSKYNIGVQKPDGQRNEYVGTVSVANQSVVASGDYERFFELDGKRYHHILNPFTGYPEDNDIKSVTIISEYSVDGDALSTTVFLLGVERGLELVEDLNQVESVIITKDNKIILSSGMKKEFELINSDYKIKN